jgi:hypothetical protein
MQPLIPSLPSKLIDSLQLLNGNPRSKNPPLHLKNTHYSKLSATVTPMTLNPKKLRREPGRQEEGGGRAHLPKAVKPGFLNWRLDAALNPKWSQSIMIIIKPQNPVFSEPKKSPITEAFVFVGGIFATTEDTRRNSSLSPVRHLQTDTDCQIVCQETRDGAELTTFVVVL